MKKISLFLFSLCLLLLVAGCDAESYNKLYDDNAAIAQSDSSLSVGSTQSSTQVLSDSKVSLSSTVTGEKTIWECDVKKAGEVEITYSLDVSSGGKAKLVLVTPEKEVIILTENTENKVETPAQTETLLLNEGKYGIKLVGYDSPKIKLTLNTSAGSFDID